MGLVERGKEMQDLDAPRPGKSRDLFGVQLEVRERERALHEIAINNGRHTRRRKIRENSYILCFASCCVHFMWARGQYPVCILFLGYHSFFIIYE